MNAEWKARVYQQREKPQLPKNWEELRSSCFKRDAHHCMRCDQRLAVTELTAHHIIPRSQGGPDTLHNLITLCCECHDIVECAGITTRAGIIGDTDDPISVSTQQADSDNWRTWVYGGCHNPRK